MSGTKTAAALAVEIGARLKLARLNRNLSQEAVAEMIGVDRKIVMNAEKGKTDLERFFAILMVLGKADQINLLLPPQEISPIQLSSLQGKQRRRASGQRAHKNNENEDAPEW